LAVDWVGQRLSQVEALAVVAVEQELAAQHFLAALAHLGKAMLVAQTTAILHIEVAVVVEQTLRERLAVT
jgi:hypothetical protein